MKQTVTFHTFRDAFTSYGRCDNFSDIGLAILFDYLTEYERDVGDELELDVIAFCCEYAEYTKEEILREYSSLLNYDEDELEDCTLDDIALNLAYYGAVCGYDEERDCIVIGSM